MTTTEYIEKLHRLSSFGLTQTMHHKLVKHVRRNDAEKLRIYLSCFKCVIGADKRICDYIDLELFKDCRAIVCKVFTINPKWKDGDSYRTVFIRK
jgi:hypothetical protein